MANKIIIFEGANCTGKTTISQILHLKIKYSIILKLAPSPYYFEKNNGSYEKEMYYQTYNLIKTASDNTVILDRFFYSEYIYANIYKNYKAEYISDILNKLNSLNRKIYFILLTSSQNNVYNRIKKRTQITDKDTIYGKNITNITNEYLTAQNRFINNFDIIKGRNLSKIIYENNTDITTSVNDILQFINND